MNTTDKDLFFHARLRVEDNQLVLEYEDSAATRITMNNIQRIGADHSKVIFQGDTPETAMGSVVQSAKGFEVLADPQNHHLYLSVTSVEFERDESAGETYVRLICEPTNALLFIVAKDSAVYYL